MNYALMTRRGTRSPTSPAGNWTRPVRRANTYGRFRRWPAACGGCRRSRASWSTNQTRSRTIRLEMSSNTPDVFRRGMRESEIRSVVPADGGESSSQLLQQGLSMTSQRTSWFNRQNSLAGASRGVGLTLSLIKPRQSEPRLRIPWR
jgi:hypothetical protein